MCDGYTKGDNPGPQGFPQAFKACRMQHAFKSKYALATCLNFQKTFKISHSGNLRCSNAWLLLTTV